MELMETVAFIHAQQTAKTGDVIPIQATVLVVLQDIRVKSVTRVCFDYPHFYSKVLWMRCFHFFSNLKNHKVQDQILTDF